MMKAYGGSIRWRPMVGVLAVGAFAFSLTLQGEPTGKGQRFLGQSDKAGPAAVRAPALDPEKRVRIGPGVPADLPMLAPVVVDWRDDPTTRALAAGEVITIRGQKPDGSVAAAPGDPCNFDYECNDCDLCTVDECGEGVCVGGVRDGFACDADKDCQGICDVGDQAGEHCFSFLDCCSERPGTEPHGDCVFSPCVELEYEQCVNTPIPDKCDGGARDQLSCECPGGNCTGDGNTTCVGGNRDGERCDCPDGTCGRGYEREAECDDELECNGKETCESNTCYPGTPLCEDPLVCDEVTNSCIEKCANDLVCDVDGLKCTDDRCDLETGECYVLNPCGPGGVCTEGDPVVCDPGRCCDAVGNCTAATYEDCAETSTWMATNLPCEDYPAGQPNICPAYSSGIAPQGDYIVEVGPITSNAPCPGYDIERLGDDYTVDPDVVAGEYMDIEILRIATSVQIPARFAIEFWDVSNPAVPLFIEDTFYPSGVNAGISDFAIHTVLFDPPLTIPTSGVVAISIATNFGPLGSISWLSTDEDGTEVDVGSNSDTTMFVDGVLITTGFLGQCSGGDRDGLYCDTRDVDADCPPDGECIDVADVLAFEMVTAEAASPAGACCVAADGGCEDPVLPWVCEDQGNVFLGAGTACDVCMQDPFNMQCVDNSYCSICVGPSYPVPPEPGVIICVDPEDCPDGDCVYFGPCLHVPPTCTINACCDPATGECMIGYCADMTTRCGTKADCVGIGDGKCVPDDPGVACPDGWDDLLYGTSCVPDCCQQPTPSYSGGDTCLESAVTAQVINVPAVGDDPVSVTVTGNNSPATFDDWNQPLCEGGSNEDQPCDPDVDCDGDDTCIDSVCVGTTNPGKACNPDSNCLPDGTCTGQACASGIFNPEGTTQDPGWWESFSIDACANVRVDMCCSTVVDPVTGPQPVRPAWAGMYGACPCGNYRSNAGVPPPIGEGLGTPGYARGAPFCNDDNLWMTFGPLPAGVYHYPIYSAPQGTFASPPGATYQFHVTVGACPKAACCGSVCVGGARADELCNPDGIPECPNGTCQAGVCVNGDLDGWPCDTETGEVIQCGGGTCGDVTGCDIINELVCNAMGGFWLAGNNLPEPVEGEDPQPVVSCGSGTELDPYVCATGLCCVGPGDCQDEDGNQCSPECDEWLCEESLYGDYVGGADCEWRQPEGPCPVCPAAAYTENCQGDEIESGYVFDVDRTNGDGRAVADDFIAQVSQIGQFCFAPCFIAYDEDGYLGECYHPTDPDSGFPPPDAWEIHFYEDDHGLPGAELAASAALEQPVDIAAKAWWGCTDVCYRCWDYAILFDPPIGGFDIGERYWVTFSGAGSPYPPEGTGCTTFIHGALDGNGWNLYEFDHYGGIDWGMEDQFGRYEIPEDGGDARPTDFSFCIEGGLEAPPRMKGACCKCDGSCLEDVYWEDCLVYYENDGDGNLSKQGEIIGRFEPMRTCGDIACEDLGAAGGGCPGEPSPIVGELCENPKVIGEGVHTFSNLCSATDPPASYPVCDNQNNLEIMADQWYQYHACDSEKRIDIDLCGSDFDTVLAVYTNGTATCPEECPPPMDLLVGDMCRDDDCPRTGPTMSTFATVVGQCFVIRVGGYAGPNENWFKQGLGVMELTCGGCFPSSPAEPDTIVYPDNPRVVLENQKIRYLSFSAGDPGKTQAVRITFKDLPAPYDGWNDVEMWVQQPTRYCENSGVKKPPCPPAQPTDEFLGATLGCDPWFGDFHSAGVIHVFHEGIVPNGYYWIDVVDAGCVDYVTNPDESFSAPLDMTQSKWGDLVRSCATCPCTPPDVSVDIATDVTAVLDKFRNLGPPDVSCAPVTKARADHDLATPNQLIDISDATCCLDAFRGFEYPPPSFPPPGAPPCSAAAVADGQ